MFLSILSQILKE